MIRKPQSVKILDNYNSRKDLDRRIYTRLKMEDEILILMQ